MERFSREIEVIEFDIKLTDRVDIIDCLCLYLLVVLVVVDMYEYLGYFVEELKVLIGVVILIGLVVVLVADYAE